MNLLVHIKSVGQTILPRFDRLEVNDGLAHNSVYSIYQDKTGFMWFATPNGLNRYDGNSIQIYQYNGSEMSLANNFVRGNIVEDNDGNIWYSNESGLFRWNVMHEKSRNDFELQWKSGL
ncbi:two-component regulator propeller domain-containing protein [Paracoccus sp. (in: a-proteobacteria)]|uniref:two-component regulator propeller domain-containing protein n=1 Tax=Paracoccus sp. TaxID=267 RepID=UPI002AFF6739|nr:two-component regulator propeller domain-containing protein [Paracoccus sp. (in: a-proteobacteria)]